MKDGWKKIGKPLIFTLTALAVIGLFYFFSRREIDNNEKIAADNVITKLISRDLELNYPSTPKSVVALYSDIISVLYKEDCSEDQVEALAKQARGLFDEELLQLNEYEGYMDRLEAELKLYEDADRYISGYEIEDGYNIEYIKTKDDSYARVAVKYYVREGKDIKNVYEEYTLREDEEGNWKILYWELTDASSMEK